jgi:hypothetical protein
MYAHGTQVPAGFSAFSESRIRSRGDERAEHFKKSFRLIAVARAVKSFEAH